MERETLAGIEGDPNIPIVTVTCGMRGNLRPNEIVGNPARLLHPKIGALWCTGALAAVRWDRCARPTRGKKMQVGQGARRSAFAEPWQLGQLTMFRLKRAQWNASPICMAASTGTRRCLLGAWPRLARGLRRARGFLDQRDMGAHSDHDRARGVKTSVSAGQHLCAMWEAAKAARRTGRSWWDVAAHGESPRWAHEVVLVRPGCQTRLLALGGVHVIVAGGVGRGVFGRAFGRRFVDFGAHVAGFTPAWAAAQRG